MENAKYALLLLLTACCLARAEGNVKTFGDLDKLQSERVYWDAQAALNKAKEAAGQGAPSSVQASTPGESVPGAAATYLPGLEKVTGSVATLSLPNGSTTMVRAGDSVQGGYVVVSVSLRGVVIRRSLDRREFTIN
ncbi:type IV pilus biogenesis protein PilP [Erwinia rhapontici]|uniref:type IV pilus biogenesis protein PilP n=1 Tax=Erwinia rhapontici TaxID=55212 RepID=UPI001331982C|nr:type IV pilus biogenesis protein PilP [Erwinia rhapontici]MBP2157388.1 type IV pilus biogenesis protein PilP [Erwinia rhapontici]